MRRSPQRSCIGCRTVRDKKDLVRVVHTPDDQFRVDTTGKLSGRGAYVCPAGACLEAAVRRKSFDRAFRQAVPPEALAALRISLESCLQDRLEKSGPATSGGGAP